MLTKSQSASVRAVRQAFSAAPVTLRSSAVHPLPGPLRTALTSHRAAVTRASTETKQSTALAAANGSYAWAQPGYLGAVVSSMPEDQQRAVFIGILAAIGAGTALSCSVLGPAISAHLPSFLQVTGKSWFPLGPIFMAAGVAHFTGRQPVAR